MNTELRNTTYEIRDTRDGMLEVLLSFERSGQAIGPAILVGFGLITTVAGLFIWLAGAHFGRIPAVLAGAVVGALCGFILAGWNFKAVLICTAAAVSLAALSQRVFFSVFAGVITGVIAFLLLADESIPQPTRTSVDTPRLSQGPRRVAGAVEVAKAHALGFRQAVRQASAAMTPARRAAVVAAAITLLAGGYACWRPASAVCCSLMGTGLIFAGMTLLLVFKGSAPVTNIGNRMPFFYLVSAGMTAFGAIEQLVLGLSLRNRESRDKDKNVGRTGRQAQHSLSWRTT